MKTLNQIVFGVLPCLALSFAAPAFAKNITVNDTQGPNAAGWGGGANTARGQGNEDNETEPGTIGNQSWDLEAFTLNGSSLKIYSGYDLLNGNNPYGLGDLFIGRAGVTKYQTGSYSSADSAISGTVLNSQFSYDYVLHFNNRSGISIGAGTYDVYKLGGGAVLDTGSIKGLSNPFKLKDGSGDITKVGSGSLSVVKDGSSTLTLEDGTTVTGGAHFIGEIDLLGSGLVFPSSSPTLFHITMACGNDNLIGIVPVPDGGTTLLLLGSSCAGLTMLLRRVRR